MPNYKQSKIYCIRCNENDDVYVGSTTLKLSLRMAQHRSNYKTRSTNSNQTSNNILKYSTAYIELIELFPCDTKEQLNRREGEIIRSMNCVNKRVEGRNKKEYYNEHKEHKKEYVKLHSEKIKAYQKQYRETHKKYDPEYSRKYYLRRKDLKENPLMQTS